MVSIWTRSWRFPLALALALAQCLASAAVPAAELGQERIVDLELVLAVDASSSVSGAEFELQIRGLAAAFRHRSLARAIRATGGLGVTLFQWAGDHQQTLSIDWMTVGDGPAAFRFAEELETVIRSIAGDTAIGGALEFALGQFEGNGFDGRRKIIDVSGDGRSNRGPAVWLARDRAVARGITVNGLAILNEDPTLDQYYAAKVIGGPGAFVMAANDYDAYRLAILAKLIREISGAATAARPRRPGARLAMAPP